MNKISTINGIPGINKYRLYFRLYEWPNDISNNESIMSAVATFMRIITNIKKAINMYSIILLYGV